MWDLFVTIVLWLLLIFFSGQVVIFIGLIIWIIWRNAIQPRLIPSNKIFKVADDMIAQYPDPEREALMRHEYAFYRCDGAKQVYWKRVRKAIWQRLENQ